MYDQAIEIASWGKNIYVKIPITNSKGEKTSGLVKKLLDKRDTIKDRDNKRNLDRIKKIYK